MLRQHVLNQRPECEMMHALLHVLTERDGGGEKPQVAEVLRSLLDPEGMEGREQARLHPLTLTLTPTLTLTTDPDH